MDPEAERPTQPEIPKHIPVLVDAVLAQLDPRAGETVLDVTVGLGGHAKAICPLLGRGGRYIGLDVDSSNLVEARRALEGSEPQVHLHRCNFRDFDAVLAGCGLDEVDIILADLGVSSTQLDQPERGFSFLAEGPLDMRMDDRLETTAADLVNRLPESKLADLIYEYSQERHSRKIARRICQLRHERRLSTTADLVEAVSSALHVDPRARKSKTHPATQTFQALRIAVNREMEALEALLDKAPYHLRPGGRLGIISFHSLEDRKVKQTMRRWKEKGLFEVLTKKPIVADEAERKANPRARSAKFRAARRTERSIDD